MTTIGTAVLQIIPSLLGVSEAIDKQIDGKVVEVKVAPKVDKTAATKAGKETGETIAKETTAAVTKGKIGQAVADDIKTSVKKAAPGKEIAKTLTEDVKKSSPGKELAKVIVDGLADGVKQGLPTGSIGGALVDKISDGLKQGIDSKGLGTQIIDSIGSVLKSGNLAGTIKDAVLPGITSIGTQLTSGAAEWSRGIADSLRSGDIKGATDEIANTVTRTTDIIATIGSTFGAQTDGIRDSGEKISGFISTVGDTVAQTVIPNLEHIGPVFEALEGKSKISASNITSALSLIAIPDALYQILNGAAQSKIKELDDAFWKRRDDDNRARDLGLKPEQPGSGEVGGPPAPGQGNRAFMPVQPHLPDELRTKVAAGQLPGYSIGPDGVILGPDGKPVPLPARARGGQISGPGTGISDSILARVSNEEFIVNADATRKNLPLLEIINSGKLPGFAGGGLVSPDVNAAEQLVGHAYSQATRFDCSGTVARIINAALGSGGDLMSTKTAAAWLAKRGFINGVGGPGDISVGWYDHGPNPNDGHMAMTLSDGRNAEQGGSHDAFLIGGQAAGASNPEFDHHMYLRLAKRGPAAVTGEGPSSAQDDSASPLAASPGGGGGSLPSSISGLSGFGLDSLGAGVGTTGSGSDLSLVGKAAGSAVSGQVASALGVFGVGDSPGWLKAASQLVGGIKIGGQGAGSSAAPISASSTGTGTPPPDGTAHGGRAGQAPGPQTVFNIRTATVEDAFLAAQRKEKERAATKISVF